ncbi:2-dehydro-3-deoxy-D-gluconate 5-dehydrogenase KduD [Methylobrevis albus]|uniref:2-dehydro-3-deoxy-D-gluconate 5-dehydrogenase KduD n=1 Tax=Methylobrevis albus TaxID=2793297 RepID=A0A931I1R1_9HYPH|nr:2-dehydro-3-deoxy-D-gluconate 5-dehydrogenase KduD [Methylobrevis albus]MBH0237695.1 2-dehydro-3-deoxy-D-gluconate 5-dehydrogenase KduD [Methylobrevis albus]
MSAFDLSGKRALVTGANTGIGQGIALSLAAAGAHVVAAGRSSMDETLGLVSGLGGSAEAASLDLSDPHAGAALVDRLNAEAPLDILVNNAGIIRRGDAVDFSEADWDDVMDVNLKAAFLAAQAFGRAAIAAGRPGKIVNIASMLSFQGGIRVVSYTASKHGIAGVTKLLACEWAAKGINVNAVAPGYISTNNTETLRNDETRFVDILKRIPAARWGEASDIGGAVVFLSSAAADYVHGAVIPVDGGWLAR